MARRHRKHILDVLSSCSVRPAKVLAVGLVTFVSLMLYACGACSPTEPPNACSPAPPNLKEKQWPAACWRPYADSSPFNQEIPPNPQLVSNSAAIVNRVLGDISNNDRVGNMEANVDGTGGEPTYYSRPTDPQFTLDCMEFGGNCSIDGMTIRIPKGAVAEGGPQASPMADRHMTVIDQKTGWEYDLWQVTSPTPLSASGGTLQFSWGGRSRIDGDGRADEPSGQVGHGTASHFANLAGRVRVEELEAGQINHALNITIECDDGTSVFPAKASDQSCQAHPPPHGTINLSNTNAPPMGSRFQLDMTQQEIDALPIREWKKVFLRAMAKYGMFMGDTGSQNLFNIETETGDQYLTRVPTNQWFEYGKQNWELYDPDGNGPIPASYVGKLYNRPDDPNPNFDWMGEVWSNLRVIDPCVSQGGCIG